MFTGPQRQKALSSGSLVVGHFGFTSVVCIKALKCIQQNCLGEKTRKTLFIMFNERSTAVGLKWVLLRYQTMYLRLSFPELFSLTLLVNGMRLRKDG